MGVFADDNRRGLEDDARDFLDGVDKKPDWQTAVRELREVIIDLTRIIDMYERRIILLEERVRDE